MRSARAVLAAALSAAVLGAGPAVAQACAKVDFETAVGDAAAALRALTQERTPLFQEKLRALKDKRNWTHDQFMTEATPLVQDQRISEYDQRSAGLLARINSMGAEGSVAAKPDCKLLAELRASMQSLVEIQQQKWAYMFDKLEQELTR